VANQTCIKARIPASTKLPLQYIFARGEKQPTNLSGFKSGNLVTVAQDYCIPFLFPFSFPFPAIPYA